MKIPTPGRRIHALFLTVAVLANAAPAASQTPASRAPAGEAAVSEVVVVGKKKLGPLAAARSTLIRPNAASSCSFMAQDNPDSFLEGYILANGGVGALRAEMMATFPEGGSIVMKPTFEVISEVTPWGDVSDPREDPLRTRGGVNPAICGNLDKSIAAGRATISRKDKTLPQGFALFQEGKYPQSLAMFEAAYKKLRDDEGGVDASLMIGRIHHGGLAGDVDIAKAVTWLERAAGSRFAPGGTPAFDPKNPQGSLTPISEASLLLTAIYLTGEHTPRDPKKVRKWLERANFVGYVPAAKSLGDVYRYGYDTPQDTKKALKYYTEAATYGFAPAQFALAELYDYGEGIPADRAKALAWYNEAAKTQHPGALYALARAYDAGDGVAANPERALTLYKTAAVAGNADAQNAMGTYFYEGVAVPKDASVARKWFASAAAKGQPDAMFNLAAMTMKGEGGERDPVKAWVWFSLAGKMGNPRAPAALAALEKRMTAEETRAANEILSPKKAG